jgi:hypothetical protein
MLQRHLSVICNSSPLDIPPSRAELDVPELSGQSSDAQQEPPWNCPAMGQNIERIKAIHNEVHLICGDSLDDLKCTRISKILEK